MIPHPFSYSSYTILPVPPYFFIQKRRRSCVCVCVSLLFYLDLFLQFTRPFLFFIYLEKKKKKKKGSCCITIYYITYIITLCGAVITEVLIRIFVTAAFSSASDTKILKFDDKKWEEKKKQKKIICTRSARSVKNTVHAL